MKLEGALARGNWVTKRCGFESRRLHNCSWVSNPESGLGSWLRDRHRIDPWWAS